MIIRLFLAIHTHTASFDPIKSDRSLVNYLIFLISTLVNVDRVRKKQSSTAKGEGGEGLRENKIKSINVRMGG